MLIRAEIGAWVSSPHPFTLGETMLKIYLPTLPGSWDGPLSIWEKEKRVGCDGRGPDSNHY